MSWPNVGWWNHGGQIYCHPLVRCERLLRDREYYSAIDKAFPAPFEGTTDRQGKLTLEMPGGTQQLAISSDVYELPVLLGRRDVSVKLSGDKATEAILRLQPRGTEKIGERDKAASAKPSAATGPPPEATNVLLGRLADIQGRPIGGVRVTSLCHGMSCVASGQTTTTDERGIFSVPTPPEGLHSGVMVTISACTKEGHTYEVNFVPAAHGTTEVHVPTHLQPKAAGPQDVGAEELAGVVVDESGQPLEGVAVSVWDDGHTGADKAVTTGKDGIFRLPKVDHDADRGVEVRFRKPGYSPETFFHQHVGEKGWVLALSNKTYFEGTVTGSDGKPAPAASIWANQGPRSHDGGFIQEIWTDTSADASGHYRLYVQPDEYEFFVKCPGVGVARLPKTAIAFGESAPLDIRLQPGDTFQAKIVDSETHQPVPNVRLSNWQHKDVEGRSDKDGIVTIRNMTPGYFQFTIKADGYTRWWSDQAKSDWCKKSIDKPELKWQRNFDYLDFDIQPGMAAVNIVMEKGVRIRGRVVDPDGRPVAGATAAPALTGTGNSLTGDTRFSVETKADGGFEMLLPASHEAKYNLVGHDGKYEEWRKWANAVLPPISTTPGQQIDGVDLQLTRPATVRGKVVDPQGNPIAHRQVRASSVDKLENRYYDPTTTAKEDGAFELRFIRPGEQYIQVAPFWLSAEAAPTASTKQVTLEAGQELNDVQLTAAAGE